MKSLEFAKEMWSDQMKENFELQMEIHDLKCVIANLEEELKYYELTRKGEVI